MSNDVYAFHRRSFTGSIRVLFSPADLFRVMNLRKIVFVSKSVSLQIWASNEEGKHESMEVDEGVPTGTFTFGGIHIWRPLWGGEGG